MKFKIMVNIQMYHDVESDASSTLACQVQLWQAYTEHDKLTKKWTLDVRVLSQAAVKDHLDFISTNFDVLDFGCHGQVSGTHIISTKVWLARLLQVVIHALQLSNEGLLLLILILARLAGQKLNKFGGK